MFNTFVQCPAISFRLANTEDGLAKFAKMPGNDAISGEYPSSRIGIGMMMQAFLYLIYTLGAVSFRTLSQMRKEIVMSEALVKQARALSEAATAHATTLGKFCDSLSTWYLELKKYNCHY